MVRELPLPIQSVISQKPIDIRAETSFIVTKEILEKISGLRTFDGVIAEVAIPKEHNLEEKSKILVLDQIQDPGNLGTLIRSALALGWEGVIATPGTVDFFNEKALRASQGAIFHLPFAYKTPAQLAQWKHTFWIADAKGEDLKRLSFSKPLALVLSNEGQGVSPWARSSGKLISIPLKESVESLNVATAGAILLYQMS